MRYYASIASLLVILAATAGAQSPPTTKGNIVGTWVKDHTQVEDSAYSGDRDWQLELVFSEDGTFAWQANRSVMEPDSPSNQVVQIDESVKGKYVKEGSLITYRFDKPSAQALKQLPQFFAFRPRQLRGQQTFSFRDQFLRLGNDGGKTWIFLKRKITR